MHTSLRLFRAAATRPRVTHLLSRISASQSEYLAQHEPSRSSWVTRQASQLQCRGKKTKSSLSLDDLPQGVIPLEPLAVEVEAPAYPTVILQARSNMRKFENCVLLTRVGGFYELYFEHAEEFGPLLGLKVAQKPTRTTGVLRYVPMAGFPFFQLDRYLKMLVQDYNRFVAIAEEFPNDPSDKIKTGGLMHDRRVSRVITPGTLIDEDFIDPFSNNYVLAIHTENIPLPGGEQAGDAPYHPGSMSLGLAWLDLSTGQFFTQFTTLSALPAFLARTGPREIVLDEDLQALKDHDVLSVLAEHSPLIAYVETSRVTPISEWSPMLESPVPSKHMEEFLPEEIAAGSALLKYIGTRLQGSNMKLQPPTRQLNVMGIDKNTMTALEIRRTIRDGVFSGSLLHTVRRTVTHGGARLLDRWLTSPSTSIDIINSRLDLVAYMLRDEELRERTTLLLKRCHDSHRLLQKFAFGRGDPDDLLALASTITATQDLVSSLVRGETDEGQCIRDMTTRINLDGPSALSKRIKEAIDEEGVVQKHRLEDEEAGEMRALAEEIVNSEGAKEDSSILKKSYKKKKKPTSIREYYSDENEAWIMHPGASPNLQNLHRDLLALVDEKKALAETLPKQLGVSSLTLRFTPGLGHICHVKGKDIKQDFSHVRSVSSSRSTRSFHHPEWTSLGQRLDQCRFRIRNEEQIVFSNLRIAVIANIVKLRRNATVLDELDIACSFATLASEKHWIRPILNTSSSHKIIAGRHPTVEGSLLEEGRTFISNDCVLGTPQKSWLITGPNMAGKSTFLRQNALITILAQVGSYVPAQYVELGIVDQLFSRVGSADNLYRDQSTFMVEMLETSLILRNATSQSFVIMDEIGRGTTPNDGTAVAFACLWHLERVNRCRTLFATHFHVLADMVEERGLQGVGFYCTDVREDRHGTGFMYVHRLREGVNRRSHALKVARLAGLPEDAISVAKEVLKSGRLGEGSL